MIKLTIEGFTLAGFVKTTFIQIQGGFSSASLS